MNLHVITEGVIGEKEIYAFWIPLVNPKLTRVERLSDLRENNYVITAGLGYPNYFRVIENGIQDINEAGNVDRLVIAIDSEDQSFQEKQQEMNQFLEGKVCRAQIITIIQHFCIETWALGNRKVGPRRPKDERLRFYKSIYNVLAEDPELLPNLPEETLNRSQFAFLYLKKMLNDKGKNLTYSKNNPKALLHRTYFNEVRERFLSTQHISSFGQFLHAFI